MVTNKVHSHLHIQGIVTDHSQDITQFKNISWVSATELRFSFIYLFVYFEKKRVGERQRTREKETTSNRLRTVRAEPEVGLEPKNHEITT